MSYRKQDLVRQDQRRGGQSYRQPKTNATVPQVSKPTSSAAENSISYQGRPSLTSSTTETRHSVDLAAANSSVAWTQARPSALPRSTGARYGQRPDTIASTKVAPTPSQVAQSRTTEMPQSHRPGSHRDIAQPSQRREVSESSESLTPAIRMRTRGNMLDIKPSFESKPPSVRGVPQPGDRKPLRPKVIPPSASSPPLEELPPGLIPELQALAAASASTTSTQPPSLSSISSPSTLFTDSPGAWSSRNTTPTSMSSYSPGVVLPLKINTAGKRANTVPAPATSKTKFPRLPVLQEAIHSSSSSVTGREPARKEGQPASRKKRTPLSSPPSSPPPRTSSVKHRHSKSEPPSSLGQERPIDTRAQEQPAQVDNRPSAERQIEKPGLSRKEWSQALTRLPTREHMQQQKPQRPSREGVPQLNPRRPAAVESTLPVSRRSRGRKQDSAVQPQVPSLGTKTRVPQLSSKSNDEKSKDQKPHHSEPHSSSVQAGKIHSQAPVIEASALRPAPHNRTLQSTEIPTSRLGKFSKFNIFSRRLKQPSNPIESTPKASRKGPVAGTGHEGYGKFARRGRKSSTDGAHSSSSSDRSESSLERLSNRFRSRKHSTGSRRNRDSQSDLDDFAAERLRPVVILGGSRRKLQADRHTSSGPDSTPLPYDPNHVHESYPMRNEAEMPHLNQPTYSASVSSAGSFSEPVQSLAPAINFDRLFQNDNVAARVYLTSTNTSQSSFAAPVTTTLNAHNDMYRVSSKSLKKTDQAGKKLKWNIFQRATSTKAVKPPVVLPASRAQMPVRISTGPMPRSMPYYAVMESESDNNTTENLGDVLSAAIDSPLPLPRKDPARETSQRHRPHGNSMLLPSLPSLVPKTTNLGQGPFPSQNLAPKQAEQPSSDTTKADVPKPSDARPRRLAAVGRIPRVVSRKGRQTTGEINTPSDMAKISVPPAQARPTAVPNRPALELKTDFGQQPRFTGHQSAQQLERRSQQNAGAHAQAYGGRREFLRFPSKHSSDVSASSTSSGVISLAAPVSLLPAHVTTRQSRHGPGEDEVWNEYDDFIDDVMSPEKVKVSPLTPPLLGAHAFPSLGQLERPGPSSLARQATLPETTSTLAIQPLPVVFPPPKLLSESGSSGDIRLRRSRIVSALHSSMDPSSPYSVGELIAEYGNWNRNSGRLSERLSTSTAHNPGYLSPVTSQNLPSIEVLETNQQHNAVLLDVVGRGKNPAAHSELHFASLMVSRWLSFGRVLFSPAHDEIHSIPERHVLVIDGLGSVDWSIFCSTVYQHERAFVHDLKERHVGQSPIEAGHAPPNYRRAEVSSLTDKFPFPPQFFSVVVIRFPPTMSDPKMKNIIQECKRVLSPGGYLELMLLDLDIVNMGVQTRRALRDLKTKLTIRDRAVSLKPLSDNMQSHLGQQGFLNLSRCVVGVPVVGKASGSMDSSASSRSSRDSHGQRQRLSLNPPQPGSQGNVRHSHRPHGHNFSLNDLVADHSENADEKIGKVVSKTARSWWQHCFEAAVIPDGNLARSIFAERAVMRECKMRGSNFKLLIAYAQKPGLENKRRTMSEPIMPTLATAGMVRTKRTV